MSIVTPHKLLAAMIFSAAAFFCFTPPAHAVDTLADAISLHQKGVSDDVLIAWATQQPPIADTAENHKKLDEAKIAKPVVDALLVGNTKPKVAVAPKKEGVPMADDTVIGLRGNGNPIPPPPAPLPPNPPVPPAPPEDFVSAYPPSTVVIDGWNVYNYDPFHTVVYGWPFVHNIYPYYPVRDYGYSYGSAYRDNDGFRWQNQIPPNLPPRNPETTIANRPHWQPNYNHNEVLTPALTPSRPTHHPRYDFASQPTTVRTPPPGIVTHETSTGAKYVTQSPTPAPAPVTSAPRPASTPNYYVPPANNNVAPPSFRR